MRATEIEQGRKIFSDTGCAACHTPELRTGTSSFLVLAEKPVPLYSDLLLHRMGSQLADDISQNSAQGYEFRTPPLWGLGHRLFFLHNGRARSLTDAILLHSSEGAKRRRKYRPSEANESIRRYRRLLPYARAMLLEFLRLL